MRRTPRHAIAAGALLVAALLTSAPPCAADGASVACRSSALARLRASSPGGWAIYRQAGDAAFFESWIDCADAQYGLPTAVHETTHFITGETEAFPLVGGGAVARPHEVSSFFPPARIADRFGTDDLTMIYLGRGKASSSTDFLYLLDEFNAYTHDLATATDLRALASPDEVVDHRDGLAAMMAFLAVYAETAQASEPETWTGLRQPAVAATVATLWDRAERVMAASCGIPNFGSSDRAYLRQACTAAAPGSAIEQILGRAAVCPTACLAPVAATVEERGSDVGPAPSAFALAADDDGTELTATIRPRHPFSGQAGPRRHRVPSDGR